MADIIDWNAFRPEGMDRAALLARLEEIRSRIAELDEQEPEDMESEAYEAWGEAHEDLEAMADEILDLLDELDGV